MLTLKDIQNGYGGHEEVLMKKKHRPAERENTRKIVYSVSARRLRDIIEGRITTIRVGNKTVWWKIYGGYITSKAVIIIRDQFNSVRHIKTKIKKVENLGEGALINMGRGKRHHGEVMVLHLGRISTPAKTKGWINRYNKIDHEGDKQVKTKNEIIEALKKELL
jgi:hypothetical protein